MHKRLKSSEGSGFSHVSLNLGFDTFPFWRAFKRLLRLSQSAVWLENQGTRAPANPMRAHSPRPHRYEEMWISQQTNPIDQTNKETGPRAARLSGPQTCRAAEQLSKHGVNRGLGQLLLHRQTHPAARAP